MDTALISWPGSIIGQRLHCYAGDSLSSLNEIKLAPLLWLILPPNMTQYGCFPTWYTHFLYLDCKAVYFCEAIFCAGVGLFVFSRAIPPGERRALADGELRQGTAACDTQLSLRIRQPTPSDHQDLKVTLISKVLNH